MIDTNNRNNLVGQLIWYVHVPNARTRYFQMLNPPSHPFYTCIKEVLQIGSMLHLHRPKSNKKNFILLIQSRSPVLSIHTHWVIPNPNMVKSHTCIKCVDVHRLKSQSLMSNRREKKTFLTIQTQWPIQPNMVKSCLPTILSSSLHHNSDVCLNSLFVG